MTTVQGIMAKDLLEETDTDNEMIELLEFTRKNGVPLTQKQAAGTFLLHQNGLGELAEQVDSMRAKMTTRDLYVRILKVITLGDRIKGNAKLGTLLKANANPANGQQKIPMGINDGVK